MPIRKKRKKKNPNHHYLCYVHNINNLLQISNNIHKYLDKSLNFQGIPKKAIFMDSEVF